jgi:hypothetical protein
MLAVSEQVRHLLPPDEGNIHIQNVFSFKILHNLSTINRNTKFVIDVIKDVGLGK